jgi:RNA polymerase sigma-70 factor, ECF subfamily
MDATSATQEGMFALSTLSTSLASPQTPDGTAGVPPGTTARLSFDEVYEAHFNFVWRSARRLGVYDGAIDDVVQETFLVVHRRLADFEGRSAVKTWLFGILIRVTRDHRRHLRRKAPHSMRPEAPTDPDALTAGSEHGPHERAAKTEAVEALHAILDELDDDKREAFILAELEQMTAPEMADALGVNLNTVYSRLRAARQEFEQAVARHRARDGWRYR